MVKFMYIIVQGDIHMDKTRKNLNFIYVLKFMSSIIIAVFLHWNDHFIPNLGYSNIFTNRILVFLTTKSYILVEMFFVISGILYYINSNEKIKNNLITFKDFFVKKMGRLLPVIIFSSIVIFLCNVLLFALGKNLWSCGSTSIFELFISFFSGRMILGDRQYLNAPIWYVNVLLLCFAIAYFLSKKSKKYKDILFLIPIVISLFLLFNPIYIFNYNIIRGFASFFIGIYTGKFLTIYNDYSDLKKEFVKIISLLLLIIYIIIAYFGKINNFYNPESISYTLFVFVPLIIFLYDFKLLNKFFSFKIFKFLSDISYSIYIWNFPILIALHLLYVFKIINFNIYSYKFFLLLFIIHIIVGTLSYIFIEKKFKNVKFSLITKLLD